LITGTKYTQSAVRLGHGDRLILYTDGVTECVDAKGNELGYAGLLALVRNLVVRDPVSMGADLLSAIESYTAPAPLADDFTILILKS
jgi:sigma-B regulation protein RsbU (phosphoserine phosphatase)